MVKSSPPTSTSVTNLRCEYKVNPLGIDARTPRLSWQLVSDGRGVMQTAYQVQAAANAEALAAGRDLLWDSGQVTSDASVLVPYGGPTLQSGQRVYWQVRVWTGSAAPSDWSAAGWWEMGLLSARDWAARWIEPGLDEDTTTPQPCPMLRAEFKVAGPVRSARAYVTAHGLYEAEINGRRVGDEQLTPGWTVYDKRLQYQTYDVTDYLTTGDNAVGVTLADGWYRGFIGFEGQRNKFGDRLALLMQINVEYADGRTETFSTGRGWKAATGPTLMADIYMGETYDARLEKPGWSMPGYHARGWKPCRVVNHDKRILEAPAGPAVRAIEEIRPVGIIHTPKGETVVDMGQNMVGHIRLTVHGRAGTTVPPGTTVTLRHFEVLDQQGNVYLTNLRSATQALTYTLKGSDEPETYEPRFTFMGFRYVQVEGWPGEVDADCLTGVVIHSDMTPTGRFSCSNPLINQLQHNITWGQKGNFVDVPTDCPQRDERLGWTGDAQVFIRTAAFNMDVAGFFTKWLRDLAADQLPNGSVTFVSPDVLGGGHGFFGAGSSAWGDAATICPWTIYLCYNDQGILAQQYQSMVGWVEFIRQQAGESYLWRSGFHFGDWLAIASPNPMMPAPMTDVDLVSTAFFAYSTALVAKAAEVLGKTADARKYNRLLERIKRAFVAEYVSPAGRVAGGSQTAYVLALHFDLLPENLRASAAARLAAAVRKAGSHLSTGFVGTPYLCHVLTRFGYTDLAYELLMQEGYPSWLYQIKMGATTIWERWDGIKPDGEFQDAGMNSFNHYSYGAVGEWLYRTVAGLDVDPAQPGYKHSLIQPQPGGGLNQVQGAIDSVYGEVSSAWEKANGQFRLTVTIPANTHATIRVPHTQAEAVTESGKPLAQAEGITGVRQEGDTVTLEAGSGRYEFAYGAVAFPQTPGEGRKFSIYSRLYTLLDDPAAREVLAKHLPMFVGAGGPGPRRVDTNNTLRQAANTAMGMIPESTLTALDEDLAKL
jgi:alpha-L-rhamnosidase